MVAALCIMTVQPTLNDGVAQPGQGASLGRSTEQNTTPIVLTGAWLIDGSSRPALENAWIRIDGNRIAAVGQGTAPRQGTVIDLQGRTVIPGLSDMHVHVGELDQAKWMLKLLLAYGITTVRDTGQWRDAPTALGDFAAVRRWIGSEAAVPHLFISGLWLPGAEMESNLEFLKGGRRLHNFLAGQLAFGVDFLKVHNWISYDALEQIGAFAKANDLLLIGHVPLNMTSLAAIDAGMGVLEHIRLRAWEVIDDPEVFARYPIDINVRSRELFWASFDPKGQMIARTIAGWSKRKDKFFFNPTLVINEGGAHYYEEAYDRLAERRLLSPAVDRRWQPARDRGARFTPGDREESRRANAGRLAFMRLVRGAGIRILTGSDTPIPFMIPGVSLHRELELLVEAGYSPVEAIHASTGLAADCLRTPGRGVLAPGQEADLVVVRGNLAADIRAVRDIEHVMLGGHLYDRKTLLAEAAHYAQRHQPAATVH